MRHVKVSIRAQILMGKWNNNREKKKRKKEYSFLGKNTVCVFKHGCDQLLLLLVQRGL